MLNNPGAAKRIEGGVGALTALGFTPLEAEVYSFLLQESPATGYRIAQALGRPVANTYKAVEALQGRGAVLVDESATRQCRAVPAVELLAQMESGFRERRRRAAEALQSVAQPAEDHRIYQLTTSQQVWERCRAMLERARKVVLLDGFPLPLAELRPDLERAAARSARVLVKAYAPVAIAGAEVIQNPNPEKMLSQYLGHWIVLFIDGSELLLAALSPDGEQVRQAV
ncbi:MAG TPA: helix-turn-helix domain-containing protein, partial [Armatimonadota bacterium]|nr:helix-turn-helix domain-containing protein [Armatimonadota bacterium]